MKIWIIIYCIPILVVSTSNQCLAQFQNYEGFVSDVVKTSRDTSKLFYRRGYIPSKIKREIRKITGTSFRIANPDQEFRATDVVTSLKVPHRRLIFLIKKKDRCLIVYERGGYTYSQRAIYYREFEGGLKDISSIRLLGKVRNVAEFIDLIEGGKFQFNYGKKEAYTLFPF